jgi:hypothetical protein
VIRQAIAYARAVHAAPPTTFGFIVGAAALAFGASVVKRYVVDQQQLLLQSMAELAAIRRQAADVYQAMEEAVTLTGDQADELIPPADYPADEDLDPVGRRFMADDQAAGSSG